MSVNGEADVDVEWDIVVWFEICSEMLVFCHSGCVNDLPVLVYYEVSLLEFFFGLLVFWK